MKKMMIGLVMLAACGTDAGPGALDGQWTARFQCVPVRPDEACALPLVARSSTDHATIEGGTIIWQGDRAEPIAIHDGEVRDGCIDVATGIDEPHARAAYAVCGSQVELAGAITWNPGEFGECACIVSLGRR